LTELDPQEAGKALAGAEAAERVTSHMRVGLGTGSTVAHFLVALGRRIRQEEIQGVVGVATSVWTEERGKELGIPLMALEEVEGLDLTVDGADEVDPSLDLIKGLGGALLREKMVAQASRELIIIADETKLVDRLGTRSPLPVEVVPFSWRSQIPFLQGLGADGILRETESGEPFSTDNGNFILDCRFPNGIDDPRALDRALAARAGIVESGLFLGMAREALVGGSGVVRSVKKGNAGAKHR